jgi:hypothetical protein
MPSKAELVAQVETALDAKNHGNMCDCVPWNEGRPCVTYGEGRPWSYGHEDVIDAILALMDGDNE